MADRLSNLRDRLASPLGRRERLAVLMDLSRLTMVFDPPEALGCAEKALRLARSLDDPFETGSALRQIGACRLAMGDCSEAYSDLREAYSGFAALGSKEEMARTALMLGNFHLQRHEHRKALSRCTESLSLFEQCRSESGMTLALQALGNFHTQLGNHAQALEHYLHNLTILRSLDDDDATGTAFTDIAITHELLGNHSDALKFFQEALKCFRASGNNLLEVRTIANIANVYYALDDLPSALECAVRAVAIYEDLGQQKSLATTMTVLGNIYEKMGELHSAMNWQHKALEILDAIGDDDGQGPVLLSIGNLCYRTGDLHRSAFFLEQALYRAEDARDLHLECTAHERLSDITEDLGDTKRALRHYRRFETLREKIRSHEQRRAIAELQIRFDVEQAEKEREIYRLRSEQLEMEVERQSRELKAMAMGLSAQQEFIGRVMVAVREIEQKCGDRVRPLAQKLTRDLKEASNGRDHWKKFEQHFEQMHPEFMSTLLQRCPDLTRAQQKLCVLIKIGLSTKEIAHVLNVGVRAVETQRFRIKPKLPPGSSLDSFLAGL